ncbi:MAG: hypothetical protein GY773_28630, partial [Actinomycetia bacterium]|nr:hypothetical protein [Actinomycetes bacterium]
MRSVLNSFVLLILGAVIAAGCTQGEVGGQSDGSTGSKWSGVIAVVNAEVYTLDPDQPWAEAFAFDAQGAIVAVGSEAEVLDLAGDEATVIDVDGNLVLPGFQDAHVHVPEAGINL